MSQLGSVKTSPQYSVVKDEKGSVIPPTQRPDGTWRKAIRVKEGYVPQDEVPLYESKGKQWASRSSQYPIGYSPVSSNQDSSKPYIPGLVILDEPSKKTKSKKKSSSDVELSPGEAGKKKNSSGMEQSPGEAGKKKNSSGKEKNHSEAGRKKEQLKEEQAPTAEPAEMKKKLRNAKKKLKEIEAIEEEIKTSGSKSVDADQRKKVGSKGQVLKDILELQQLTLNS